MKNTYPKYKRPPPPIISRKQRKGNGEGSQRNYFGKYIGEGVTYLLDIASNTKDIAKEKPSTNTSSISTADNSL